MMSEHFWSNLKSLAAFLDDDGANERVINALEDELHKGDKLACQSACEDMDVVIAQLSRLRFRVNE
jgi:hypothetical protein